MSRLLALAAAALVCGSAQAGPHEPEGPAAVFERGRARVQAEFPGLIESELLADGLAMTGVGDAEIEALFEAMRAGSWTPEMARAFRVVLAGLSLQAGVVAYEGREILQQLAGTAGDGGHRTVIYGVTELLTELVEDAAHAYSLLAQDLLSEKLRCGAVAIGDTTLVAEIARRVDPDREFSLHGTDGTIADRYGVHAQADLFSVASDDTAVVAAGYFGTVLVSPDSGDTWLTPDTGTDEALFAVAKGPGVEWWAAGRNGAVLHSRDAGASWSRRPTPFQRHFFGVVARGPEQALVVGDFGLQLETADGGAAWRCVPREEDVILGRIVPAAGDALVVGEFGTLERLPGRRPPGRLGSVHGVPEDLYVFDAWFDAAGVIGVAVGLQGTVLRTSDGGDHWTRVSVPFDADLFGAAGAGDRVVVVGEGGFAAFSEDAGLSFRELPDLGLFLPLHDVTITPGGTVFAVGPRGAIFRASTVGAPFAAVHPPALAALIGGER